MLEALALCITVYDSASLHLSFYEGRLSFRADAYGNSAKMLGNRARDKAGGDEKLIIAAMQDAYARAIVMSGVELVAEIAACEAKFGEVDLPR